MGWRRYDEFFADATGHTQPFGYQCRLACGEVARLDELETLVGGRQCDPLLINAPTGSGKTAAVVLSWLWNRTQIHHQPEWPRRLVYCLPMRTLVEQTRTDVTQWLKSLAKKDPDNHELKWLSEHSPVILMGGEETESEWDIYPERPAVIIGTQDMLLSRALNRGYAMSRYRWPMHFGLLNNDCLWVMDEVQLMGPGLATACQLEAFRRAPGVAESPRGLASFFGSSSATWYASATTSLQILKTKEWRDVDRHGNFVLALSDADKAARTSVIGRRRFALKKLVGRQDLHFGHGQAAEARATDIVTHHGKMVKELARQSAPLDVARRSLILCNTVERALNIFTSLHQKQQSGDLQDVDLLLLHSRFRPPDRRRQTDRLKPENLKKHANGQIVVATQVIEAGVDISSAVLWTEIAPLASLVQRFGRLNRVGEFGSSAHPDWGWVPQAIVLGMELPPVPVTEKAEEREKRQKETARRYLPYAQASCEKAWQTLGLLNGNACPAALETAEEAIAASMEISPYSLRRHELLDFFDTDSNLSLGYTDVSPFVRGLDSDTDVYVLWRQWVGDPNGHFAGDIARDELCAVPISRLTGKEGFAKWRDGWLWLGRERGWVSARQQGLLPGAILMLPAEAGGYSPDFGWTGDDRNERQQVEDLYEPAEQPSDEDMLSCLTHGWRSIPAHTEDVRAALSAILQTLPPDPDLDEVQEVWRCVVDWHDVGKNHEAWRGEVREVLKAADLELNPDLLPLAKFSLSDSPKLRDKEGQLLAGDELRREIYRLKNRFRPRIAHEVASALALRQWHIRESGDRRSAMPAAESAHLDQLLAEYLVMSHHGHVRKVLRDEIPKTPPREAKSAESVRGVCGGDELPAVTIDGEALGCRALSVSCRQMGRDADGQESYTRGVLRLLDHYGPLRLAYMEAIFRAADARASKEARQSKLQADRATGEKKA